MFLWDRLVAILSSQFILKLSQMVLHFSDPCLCVLPIHTQLSQPARKEDTHATEWFEFKWLYYLHTCLSCEYVTVTACFIKLWGVCAWKQSGLVINPSHSCPPRLTDNGTVPCPAFLSVCVCMMLCPHSDCVSFNSFFFRSSISWSCRFSSRQDSSSAFRAGSELLTESYRHDE